MRELSVKLITSLILVFLCGGVFLEAVPKYSDARFVAYSFTLRNTTSQVIEKAEFWAYAPVQRTATQYCGNIESSYPFNKIVDSVGNQILHFTVTNMPPYGQQIISIKAYVQLSDTPQHIKVPKKIFDAYLLPERNIESVHPDILRAAELMRANSQINTAKNIFQWVAENVAYEGYLKEEHGALYALHNKKGDCTEYAALFTALCRASGIRGRTISGYVCADNKILKPDEYHDWAEIFVNNRWRLSDPQNKVFSKGAKRYVAIRISNNAEGMVDDSFYRFKVSGNGLVAEMNR